MLLALGKAQKILPVQLRTHSCYTELGLTENHSTTVACCSHLNAMTMEGQSPLQCGSKQAEEENEIACEILSFQVSLVHRLLHSHRNNVCLRPYRLMKQLST